MWAKFCGFLLRAMGWTVDGGPVEEDKAVILGVPHTSIWDFVVSYLFYTQFGKDKAKVMIKKEFFFWPVGPILKAMGGVPVDRTNATTMVKSLITAMKSEKRFILAIAPEGTRKPVKKWKTGYHTIARECGCAVYLGYFDWGTKHIGCGERFEISDDARRDTDEIQKKYSTLNLRGKNSKGYTTGYEQSVQENNEQ